MTSETADFLALFEYRTLPKIHGEPDYSQLKNLKDKLRTNALKITSDLGGGAHGHLGLVLLPTEYENASATPYNKPSHPGPLTVPAAATARQETGL